MYNLCCMEDLLISARLTKAMVTDFFVDWPLLMQPINNASSQNLTASIL
jgi:hypothetical protein